MSNPMTLDQDRVADPESQTAPEAGASFGDILSAYEQAHSRRPEEGGQGRRTATVVAVTPENVVLDIGMKTEGILPAARSARRRRPLHGEEGRPVACLHQGPRPEGYYQLSLIKVERPKDWSSLEKAFAEKAAIAGVVSGVVKGGLSVDVGVRAFMPASRSGARDAAEMEKLVGQEINCRIIKLDVADEDVVVDRRAVLEEDEARAKEQRFAEIQEGEVVHGHRPQPDRLRRLRGHRRRGRPAARGGHLLEPRQQARGRAHGGAAGGGPGSQGGPQEAAHLARA